MAAWHNGLTQNLSADLEKVQRVAVNIILSDNHTGLCEFSYDMALVVLDLEPLSVRRERLRHTFAKKTIKSRHSDVFQRNESDHFTRNKVKYIEHKSNTKRCYNFPLKYLTRLLNE